MEVSVQRKGLLVIHTSSSTTTTSATTSTSSTTATTTTTTTTRIFKRVLSGQVLRLQRLSATADP